MIQNETTPTATLSETLTETDSVEAELTDEIGNLWQVHSQAQTSLHKTRDELKVIRTDLSRKLHELKAVLSRPGRGGAWSSFLVTQSIPRSTADRLVRTHKKRLTAKGDKCLTEQISELTEVTIRRCLHGLWPNLRRVLTTRKSVEMFIEELRTRAEKSFEADAESFNSSAKDSAAQSTAGRLHSIGLTRAGATLSRVADSEASINDETNKRGHLGSKSG